MDVSASRSQESVLADPDRLAAVSALGLDGSPDAALERFARRVHDLLDVPVATVSLVRDGSLLLPGVYGLPRPGDGVWAPPVSFSYCQHVVGSDSPLVVADACASELPVSDLVSAHGLVAYAGVPLTDGAGRVLGALSALDTRPRAWSSVDLQQLDELARDCSNDLRLRLAGDELTRERRHLEHAALRLQDEADRSRTLLAMAEALSATRSEAAIRSRLRQLAEGTPGFDSVHLHLAADIEADPSGHSPAVLEAARRLTLVSRGDLADESADDLTVALRAHHRQHPAPEIRALVCAPVVGSLGLLGVMEMLWTAPRRWDERERTMTSTCASYVAQALERTQLLERRSGVAQQLQSAMLTTLPDVPDLSMAACYVAATAEESIGGDWFDAIVLPPTDDEHDLTVAVTVGDVTGHDIPAATVMGQARAMLRQTAFDLPGSGPGAVVTHFEQACEILGIEARGTVVLARLERAAGTGDWTMTWTSAGHPPPLLALPDGTVRRLELSDDEQGLLFGYRDLDDSPRRDCTVGLPHGATVLFYTDGVIEFPGLLADDQMDELGDVLLDQHARGPQAVVDAVSMQFGSGYDDLVALAVQVHPPRL